MPKNRQRGGHRGEVGFSCWGSPPAPAGPRYRRVSRKDEGRSAHEAGSPIRREGGSDGLHAKFDLAAAHELRLDHSLVVPLHFLNPSMELPVIPLYTNGFASPLPPATRCFSLG
ncbi:MAG: hypothetical protein HY694_00750, partial [Deltaproteobacteria bacterium]|nr:hypothetical protein [Deltaproteobacteria bacterium]